MFKYVPLISGGQKPVIEEKDEFKVTVPYLMAGPAVDIVVKDVVKDVVKELSKRQIVIINDLSPKNR